MQDAQPPRPEVGEAAEGVEQIAPPRAGESERHRVDGEVAARQVVLDARAEAHLGQRAGPRVAFAPQRREAETVLAAAHRGRAEARRGVDLAVLAGGVGRRPRERPGGVRVGAREREIEVARRRPPGGEVAERAADRPDLDPARVRRRERGVEQRDRAAGEGGAEGGDRRPRRRVSRC